MRHRRDDAGFSTVVTLGLMVLLLALTAVVAAIGAITVARHRAEAAADLAALAAAHHALEGPEAACAAALRVVRSQAATMTSCRLDGLDAVVVVTLRPPGRLGALGTVRGTARAGAR